MKTFGIRVGLVIGGFLAAFAGTAQAGSIFLTGHDPDFHAFLGGNSVGAQHINQRAISYITDPVYNPFTIAAPKFLFVESSISAPGGHVDGLPGLAASGFVNGTNFEKHDASDLNAELAQLGTKYDAIVVGSDFGGILTQAELNILNAHSAQIITFLNNGGGLYAMAESNLGQHLTPGGGHFGFLPFIVSATSLDQSEVGFTVSPIGTAIGLTNLDINGNASHNFFTGTGGMDPVDFDAAGRILSLATRSLIDVGGVTPVPLPSAFWAGLSLLGLLGATRLARRVRTPVRAG